MLTVWGKQYKILIATFLEFQPKGMVQHYIIRFFKNQLAVLHGILSLLMAARTERCHWKQKVMAVDSLQKYLLVAKIFNNVRTKEEWEETKERRSWKLFIALSDKNSIRKNAQTDK